MGSPGCRRLIRLTIVSSVSLGFDLFEQRQIAPGALEELVDSGEALIARHHHDLVLNRALDHVPISEDPEMPPKVHEGRLLVMELEADPLHLTCIFAAAIHEIIDLTSASAAA